MRCGRCGRPLKREESVRLGIGPVCRARLKREESIELRCHHGFTCLPSVEYHVPTLLARARRRYSVYGIPWDEELERIIIDELGIERERIQVDVSEEVEKLFEERLREKGEVSYREEVNLAKEVCRRKGICPYGLDCRDPERALDAVYGLIAKAIEHMETKDPELPFTDAIDSLIDLLQVFGFANEREHYYRLEKELRRRAREKEAKAFADEFVKELFGDL